ncbi:MAG TPA: efflux RND transporter periplasmic adaptor subunit [Bryobacteraceae bacterium]|jgi:RND family efflux transporter MFP subunit
MTALKYLSYSALAALIVLAAACGRSNSTASAKSDPVAPQAQSAPSISTVRAEARQVSASVQATGSFIAEDASDVAPETNGVIKTTPVDVGSYVTQGQVIARLDDRDPKLRLQQAQAARAQAEAALRQAESKIGLAQNQTFDAANVPEVLAAKAAYESAQAQAKLAQADAQRYANLVSTGDVSRSAYDKAQTQADTAVAQANSARQQYEATLNAARQNYQGVATQQASLEGIRAQLALAEKALADTEIRAPFAGYVSARPVAAGEYVDNKSKIATIVRLTPIKLELQVAEANSPRVKVGLTVTANVSGYPGRDFAGRVIAINPAVDPNSRTFAVQIEFQNADLALKPGMFATARIMLPGNERGIFVPREAVLTDLSTNSSQVFVIREGKAHVAVVQLGEADGDSVRILSGISPDAVLATTHLRDLYDGETVKLSGEVTPDA